MVGSGLGQEENGFIKRLHHHRHLRSHHIVQIKQTTTKAKVKDNIYIYNQSATPDESPKLIKDKLAEFELILDVVCDKEKKGYLMAKEVGRNRCCRRRRRRRRRHRYRRFPP